MRVARSHLKGKDEFLLKGAIINALPSIATENHGWQITTQQNTVHYQPVNLCDKLLDPRPFSELCFAPLLVKQNIKEDKHLFRNAGNVPAINADIWDEFKDQVKGIKITTDRGRLFKCDSKKFEDKREEINYTERQYLVGIDDWEVTKVGE